MIAAVTTVTLLIALAPQAADKTTLNEELWDAARAGDVARVTQALDRGADINAGNRYIPTPLYYDGLLYTCDSNGVLTAYDAKTGARVYRARVGGGGAFAASPIAADGKLYLSSEDGDIFVARAGRQYEELAKNSMKEVIMSTPAISDGLMIVRTLGHVYGIGERK